MYPYVSGAAPARLKCEASGALYQTLLASNISESGRDERGKERKS